MYSDKDKRYDPIVTRPSPYNYSIKRNVYTNGTMGFTDLITGAIDLIGGLTAAYITQERQEEAAEEAREEAYRQAREEHARQMEELREAERLERARAAAEREAASAWYGKTASLTRLLAIGGALALGGLGIYWLAK
jgi:K+-sensing histidine kinase KdpD